MYISHILDKRTLKYYIDKILTIPIISIANNSYIMKSLRTNTVLSALLIIHSLPGFASGQNDIFGVWGTVKLQGDLRLLSPDLNKFKWLAFNQTRTRDDSSKGSRYFQNLLFGQLGYQLNNNASVWLGYAHIWTSPLNKSSFEEIRPFQDFIWNQKISSFKFVSRSRMEQRVRESTGNVGYRARQLLKISHPLPFIDGLSAYIGDEIFFHLNRNKFGKKGFSQNRAFTGLSYQVTEKSGVDLGYMGQYVDTISGRNIFTHNIQVTFRHKF